MEPHELERLKNSKKMACDGWVYAIQRMDLLIISISGAGVWIILETLKYSYEHTLCSVIILKVAGFIFVLAMVINFGSQWTGKRTNLHHISWIDEQIKSGNSRTSDQQIKITTLDCKAENWGKATNILNFLSMLLMLAGLLLTVVYFSFVL